MHKILFFIFFLTSYNLIKCQSYSIDSSKITLVFNYYTENLNNVQQIQINANIITRYQITTAYILTGNKINKTTLNVSSILCTIKSHFDNEICQDKSLNLYVILEHIFQNNIAIEVNKNDDSIKNLLHHLYLNRDKNNRMNLTCTIRNIYDKSKNFQTMSLNKTSFIGFIFLGACVLLSFALCIGWFVIIYCRRFEQRRMKNKLQKALARSVQQMLDESPIIIYDSNNRINDSNDDDDDDNHPCAICLETFIDNEKLRKLVCSHYFHITCIDPWLIAHQNCPLCNRNILNDPVPSISARIASTYDEINTQESNFINTLVVTDNNLVVELQTSNS